MYPRSTTSVGSLCTYCDVDLAWFASPCVKAFCCDKFVCDTDAESELLRCAGGSTRALSLFWMKFENMASAAASVGSSRRTAAGVPVRDRERLVDLPKLPVSGIVRRGPRNEPPSDLSLLELDTAILV